MPMLKRFVVIVGTRGQVAESTAGKPAGRPSRRGLSGLVTGTSAALWLALVLNVLPLSVATAQEPAPEPPAPATEPDKPAEPPAPATEPDKPAEPPAPATEPDTPAEPPAPATEPDKPAEPLAPATEPDKPAPAEQPDKPSEPTTSAASLPVAPGDRLVFVRDGDIWTAEPDGGAARPLTSSPDREVRPVPSPDGSAVAYEVYDTDKQDYDIWLQPVEGGSARRLIERARNPSWSPDGGRLLFAMRRRSSLDLWLMNRDGKGLMRLLDTLDNEYLPVWAPDGARLAFVREIREANRTRYELILRAADGTEETILSRLSQGISSLCWAPSADLLFTSREPDDTLDRLYRVSPDQGEAVELTAGFDGGAAGLWTGTGDGILYLEKRNETSRIAFLAQGQSQAVTGLRDGDAEVALLPGPSHRAAQITVLGRRSYYLPTPVIAELDVLVPLPDLAVQLGLEVKDEGETVTIASPTVSITIDPGVGQATVATATGPEDRAILPRPETIGGVLMLPLKTIAEWFGLRVEWKPAERLLRISNPNRPAAPPATGEPPPEPGAPPPPGDGAGPPPDQGQPPPEPQ